MSDKEEDLGTLADYIRHPEQYSTHVDEDLDWVITRKKPEPEKQSFVEGD